MNTINFYILELKGANIPLFFYLLSFNSKGSDDNSLRESIITTTCGQWGLTPTCTKHKTRVFVILYPFSLSFLFLFAFINFYNTTNRNLLSNNSFTLTIYYKNKIYHLPNISRIIKII